VALVVSAVALGALARPVAASLRRLRGPGSLAGLDLERTRDFVAEWARRDRWDRFPESPSFAFANAYATRALGGRIPTDVRGRILDYLRRCQRADGGFAPAPDAGESHVVSTHDALRALALLDGLGEIDAGCARSYLASLARSDGAFRGRAADAEGSLGTTYRAVAALDLLGGLGSVDRGATLRYVEAHREPGRGYGLLPGKRATPAGTFMAVRLRRILRAPSGPDLDEVANWLAGTRYAGHLAAEAFTLLPQLDELVAVLTALDDLGRIGAIQRPAVERFLAGLYVPENGGFGPEPGLGTTPPATALAIECLVRLGHLPDPLAG
jgi:hypothetical protein